MSEPHTDTANGAVDEQVPLDGPAGELDALRQRAETAERRLDEALRQAAEYDNLRKRAARDLETERKYTHDRFAADLLIALDNLERAVAAAKQGGDVGTLLQGVQATQHQFLQVLKRHGVTPIEAARGTPFDPNVHQAVRQEPTADQEPGTVVDVLQSGFMIHDRVLRPAYVVVAAAP